MKKLLSAGLAAAVLTAGMGTASLAVDSITVEVDGRPVVWTDAEPFIDENDRTLVPLRAVADAMGLAVEWDDQARTASFTGSRITDESAVIELVFTIDSPVAVFSETTTAGDGSTLISDGVVTMDTAPVIVDSRAYAPARYLAEMFGYEVGWDSETGTAVIDGRAAYVQLSGVDFTPEYVSLGYEAGPRWSGEESLTVTAVRVNGEEAVFRNYDSESLRALSAETDREYVMAAEVEWDFTSEPRSDGSSPTYEIEMDVTMTHADGTVQDWTETYVWTCDSYGGT